MKKNSFNIGDFNSEMFFSVIEDITISPLTPKLNTVSLPERDGVLDFSNDNKWGRNVYEPRIITITGIVKTNYWSNLNPNRQAEKMVVLSSLYSYAYKNAKGKLNLGITPGVYWEATLEGIKNFENTGNVSFRVVLQYRCQPFSKDNNQLGISKTLIPTVEFEIPETYEWAPTNSFSVEVSSYSENVGEISIVNSTTNEILTISDIDFTGTNKLIVDFENFNIDYTPKTYKNKTWTGDFFEIKPGNNLVLLSNVEEGTATLRYTPQYFYGKLSASLK